jgi:hypothetical protein
MPARRPDFYRDDRIATVRLTARDRVWFNRMRAAINCPSDANLIRIALWRMARHLDLDVGIDVFKCRKR